MQQLMFLEPGRLEVQEAPAPELRGPGEALVRPLAVAACDLDLAIVHGHAPLRGPFAFGHEGVFEVVEAGDAVRAFAPGDVVSVPYHVSCGSCASCRRGRTAACTGHGAPGAALFAGQCYGLAQGAQNWGGFLSDLVRVPYADHMLLGLPAEVDPVAVASLSDNIVDGWRCVAAPLAAEPGAPVLVVGGTPSVGLYAAGVAVALGAERVDYVDTSPDRLERAERLGATPVPGTPERLGPYPITVDAAAHPDGLRLALRSVAPGGTCTSIGIYYAPVELPLLELFLADVTFRTGMAHTHPARAEALALVAAGRLHPELVTAAQVAWDDAVDALSHATGKLVVTRSW
jgi:threonine dehydrogenase-like Zn-dependent dehydrogenase